MEVNKVQLNSCNFNKTKKKHMITNREEEDDIELSLQSYEAQRIDYYDENGKEIYARKLTDEEQFSIMIDRFDFLIHQNITVNNLNEISLEHPKLREAPKKNPWIKPREWLFDACFQNQKLVDVCDHLRPKGKEEGNEKNILSTIAIDNPEMYDIEGNFWEFDPEYANKLYKSKQNQLIEASTILKKGMEQIREKCEKDRDFHNQVFQLQKRWLIKPSKTFGRQVYDPRAYSSNAIIGNTVPIIDLGNTNAFFRLYGYIPVILLRTKDNKLDMKIPSICTYGKRVILASRLIKEQSFTNFDQILEAAQQSIFSLELFDLFTACLISGKYSSNGFRILQYTEYNIKIKLDTFVYVSISLEPKQKTPFWDISCKVYLPEVLNRVSKPNVDNELVKCLLQECFIGLRENYVRTNVKTTKHIELSSSAGTTTLAGMNNPELADKCVEAFVNVLDHLNHKYYCQLLVSSLLNCSNYKDIHLVSSNFPSRTTYQLTLQSNKMFILDISRTKIVAQKSHIPSPISKQTSKSSKDAEYRITAKHEVFLEFDSPDELVEFISLV